MALKPIKICVYGKVDSSKQRNFMQIRWCIKTMRYICSLGIMSCRIQLETLRFNMYQCISVEWEIEILSIF